MLPSTYINSQNMEEETYQFTIGQTFKTYDSLKYYFHKFCKTNHQPFVIRSHSKKQIIYKCCHGVQRKSKCMGLRPNQHYYFKGCGAQINLYKNKEGRWKVTKMELSHNHPISKEEYSFYHRMNSYSPQRPIKTLNDSDNEEEKQLTQQEKFNMAFTIVRNIADVLSGCETSQFLTYMQELQIIENNARQGVALLHSET